MKKLLSKLVYTIVFFMCISVCAQRGIGTNNPDKSAILELKSTTQGFLPPSMTSAQLGILKNTSPAEGLLVYCSDCPTRGVVVFDGTAFISSVDVKITKLQAITSNTGKVWMDRNLGASQVATAYNDVLSYGDYYKWGNGNPAGNYTEINGINDANGGNTRNFSWNGGTKAVQDDPSWNALKGSQDPCPEGFRVPTETEWEAERNQGGINEWGTGNTITPFFSRLKLPSAGYRHRDSDLTQVGEDLFYWSSTVSGSDAIRIFGAPKNTNRSHGFSIRCIKM